MAGTPKKRKAAAAADTAATAGVVDDEAVEVLVPVEEKVAAAAEQPDTEASESSSSALKNSESPSSALKKKRNCRYPGCTKVIKSQGSCQRHGAKAKRCKVDGCEKQAQGTHDGMCKRHWKAVHFPAPPPKAVEVPPPPEGESVYENILPASVSYRPTTQTLKAIIKNITSAEGKEDEEKVAAATGTSFAPAGGVMPLVTYLRGGIASKQAGWHRNSERRARGMFPVAALSVQLEPWERQLALFEIMLLSGGTPQADLKDLAHAWGREKGFHQLLVQSLCERRGELERKKRSDAGKSMVPELRQAFRDKLKKARLSKKEDETKEPEAPPEELKEATVDMDHDEEPAAASETVSV